MSARSRWSWVSISLFAALHVATSEAPPEVPAPVGPTAAVAHCDAIAVASTCVEYGAKAEAESECASLGGVVADGACPADGRVGGCEHLGQLRRYYAVGGAPSDAGFAQKHCQNALSGTFLP
jgi:hypothetical protein